MSTEELKRRKVQVVSAVGGRLLLAASMVLPVAGCVRPAERIATSLTAYGLDAGKSNCVGDHLERGLSIGQLQQLGRAARAYSQGNAASGRLTVADLIRAGSQIDDVRIPIEVGKAAAGCGVLAGTLNTPAP